MKYKNIIFDLDGTLWDSRHAIVENWNQVLSEYSLLETPLKPDDMNPYMGLLATDVLKDLYPKLTTEKIREILDEIERREAGFIQKVGGVLYPNVSETLFQLQKNYRLFIVSNCQDGYIEAFLEYFQFQAWFQDFESFGRTGENKAQNIKKVLDRNELSRAETVYVGDTRTDCESARANDLDFIFCRYGFGKLEEAGVVGIDDFEELLAQ